LDVGEALATALELTLRAIELSAQAHLGVKALERLPVAGLHGRLTVTVYAAVPGDHEPQTSPDLPVEVPPDELVAGDEVELVVDDVRPIGKRKYPRADAVWTVEHLEVNWNEQAVKAARQYLNTSSFSCQGLIEQLSSEAGSKFTVAQAEYAANKVDLC
jgi:Host cell surface-exposed lipoprotein